MLNMHELHTEIEIQATPERIWSVLTDFAAYPQWNPFIRSVEGSPEKGASLTVRIEPSGAKAMTFRPRVLVADRPHELRWLGLCSAISRVASNSADIPILNQARLGAIEYS